MPVIINNDDLVAATAALESAKVQMINVLQAGLANATCDELTAMQKASGCDDEPGPDEFMCIALLNQKAILQCPDP